MKKLVCSLLVIAMIFTSSVCTAESEYSDYSIEELLALRTELDKEIATKSEEEDCGIVYSGVYTVGEDIDEGTYIAVLHSIGDRALVTVDIWYDSISYEKRYILNETSFQCKEIGDAYFLNLSNGNILSINCVGGSEYLVLTKIEHEKPSFLHD